MPAVELFANDKVDKGPTWVVVKFKDVAVSFSDTVVPFVLTVITGALTVTGELAVPIVPEVEVSVSVFAVSTPEPVRAPVKVRLILGALTAPPSVNVPAVSFTWKEPPADEAFNVALTPLLMNTLLVTTPEIGGLGMAAVMVRLPTDVTNATGVVGGTVTAPKVPILPPPVESVSDEAVEPVILPVPVSVIDPVPAVLRSMLVVVKVPVLPI